MSLVAVNVLFSAATAGSNAGHASLGGLSATLGHHVSGVSTLCRHVLGVIVCASKYLHPHFAVPRVDGRAPLDALSIIQDHVEHCDF